MNRSRLVDAFLPQLQELWRTTGIKLTITVDVPHEHFRLLHAEICDRYVMRWMPAPRIPFQIHDQIWVREKA